LANLASATAGEPVVVDGIIEYPYTFECQYNTIGSLTVAVA
jgi:hypothetical protein